MGRPLGLQKWIVRLNSVVSCRFLGAAGSAVRHLSAHPMLPMAAAASSDGHVMVYMQEDARKGAEVA